MLQILKKNGRCCITGRSMQSSKYVNLVSLDRICPWEHAVAIVHDDCWNKVTQRFDGKILRAVEIKGSQIIYHQVEDLEKIIPVDKN